MYLAIWRFLPLNNSCENWLKWLILQSFYTVLTTKVTFRGLLPSVHRKLYLEMYFNKSRKTEKITGKVRKFCFMEKVQTLICRTDLDAKKDEFSTESHAVN